VPRRARRNQHVATTTNSALPVSPSSERPSLGCAHARSGRQGGAGADDTNTPALSGESERVPSLRGYDCSSSDAQCGGHGRRLPLGVGRSVCQGFGKPRRPQKHEEKRSRLFRAPSTLERRAGRRSRSAVGRGELERLRRDDRAADVKLDEGMVAEHDLARIPCVACAVDERGDVASLWSGLV
jgi:hypothetical protein